MADTSSAEAPANGYLPHLFLFTLPVRPTPGQEVFLRPGLRIDLKLTASPVHGVPHGSDRMILLLLSTYAVLQASPEVDLGPAGRILAFFGLKPDGRNYERLAQRFERVLGSTYEFTFRPNAPEESTRLRTIPLCAESRLWYRRETAGTGSFRNAVSLSPEFWEEVRRSTVVVPLQPYRALLDSPGNLDLYLWLLAQSQLVRPGRYVKVPITGEASLAMRLGAKQYAQDRDFRRKARTWLRRILHLWPECPAAITSDHSNLVVSYSGLGKAKPGPEHVH